MDKAQKFMKDKEKKTLNITSKTKGELVDYKDDSDLVVTPEYKRENPYKTPPNNLTSKQK